MWTIRLIYVTLKSSLKKKKTRVWAKPGWLIPKFDEVSPPNFLVRALNFYIGPPSFMGQQIFFLRNNGPTSSYPHVSLLYLKVETWNPKIAFKYAVLLCFSSLCQCELWRCGLCSMLFLFVVCVCVCFCRNINNGKMMILVVAPVLQASLYLMLHGDWHTLFLIPQQTHQKNLIFVLFFGKESMQRRRDDCYPYKSVYITTWWFYNMHYHLISFCSFQFQFFIVFFFSCLLCNQGWKYFR